MYIQNSKIYILTPLVGSFLIVRNLLQETAYQNRHCRDYSSGSPKFVVRPKDIILHS